MKNDIKAALIEASRSWEYSNSDYSLASFLEGLGATHVAPIQDSCWPGVVGNIHGAWVEVYPSHGCHLDIAINGMWIE